MNDTAATNLPSAAPATITPSVSVTITREAVIAATAALVKRINDMRDALLVKQYGNCPSLVQDGKAIEQVHAEVGVRYIKLIKAATSGNPTNMSRSVYGFIDMTTGDVLKAASWKKPAKGVRGNLFAPDGGFNACTEYGIIYNNRR